LDGCVSSNGDECSPIYSDEQSAVAACEESKAECNGIADGGSDGEGWSLRTGVDFTAEIGVQSKRRLACGSWVLRSDGTEGGRGCGLQDFQTEVGWGKTLEECLAFCIEESPIRSGKATTHFAEYHEDTFCGCFTACDYERDPGTFTSAPYVYEFVSEDLLNAADHPSPTLDYENNVCTASACAFSDPATWQGSVPTSDDTDIIYVPEQVALVLDASVYIRFWVIEGTVEAARGSPLRWEAEAILINGGTLRVGTADAPFTEGFEFAMHGHWHTPTVPIFGTKVIGLSTGTIELYGEPVSTWAELASTADAGATSLTVIGEMVG
jgi:hypothetical protein